MKKLFVPNGEIVTLTNNIRNLGHGEQVEVICQDGTNIWVHIEDLIY